MQLKSILRTLAAGMTVIFSQGVCSANIVLSDTNLYADTSGL